MGFFIFEEKFMLKNLFVIILALIIGSVVNMSLVITGHEIFPLTDGFDPKNAMHWELRHFVFPFLAHALGTLSGSFIVAKFCTSYHKIFALSIGAFFLIGGVMMVFIIPAPIWFLLLDLIISYIPMGYLGWKIVQNN